MKNKKRIKDVLWLLCEEHPEELEVQTLKARYVTLLDDKPVWIRDVAAGEQIKNVLDSLNNDDDDLGGGCSSLVVSQYCKSMRKTRGAKSHNAHQPMWVRLAVR